MKITLVTEHKIIIGTLISSASQMEAGRPVQSAVNLASHECNDTCNPCCGREDDPGECITLQDYRNPLQATDTPPKLVAQHDTYQLPLTNLAGTPAVLPQTLSPCAEGECLSLVLQITNIVERNASG